MNSKEKLAALRAQLDEVDGAVIALLDQRMAISEEVAAAKAQGNIAVVDAAREQQVIERAQARAAQGNRAEAATLMQTLMALSKLRQQQKLQLADPVALPPAAPWKTDGVQVGYQGVAGAWGESGAQKLFPQAALHSFGYFEDVFAAVKAGEVDYGVLPIENAKTGAIGEVYDHLRRHACYIVGETWVPIAQCLLALPGTALEDIRQVHSHPEGFNQCRRFCKGKAWDLTACRNTAYAAELVAGAGDKKNAAIGSRRAAQVHGLEVLVPDIMDDPGNRTRFIAIAAAPIFDDAADTVSISFSTAHVSGALCAVLQSFMLAGINLKRIESRPAAQGKYRFFADLEANVGETKAQEALNRAAMQCEYFEVLGCYRATV